MTRWGGRYDGKVQEGGEREGRDAGGTHQKNAVVRTRDVSGTDERIVQKLEQVIPAITSFPIATSRE